MGWRVESWESAYEDSQLTVRRDPPEPKGYCVVRNGTEEYLFFSRSCSVEIVFADRDVGRQIITNLTPLSQRNAFLEDPENGLNCDSLLATMALTYIREKAEGRFSISDEN